MRVPEYRGAGPTRRLRRADRRYSCADSLYGYWVCANHPDRRGRILGKRRNDPVERTGWISADWEGEPGTSRTWQLLIGPQRIGAPTAQHLKCLGTRQKRPRKTVGTHARAAQNHLARFDCNAPHQFRPVRGDLSLVRPACIGGSGSHRSARSSFVTRFRRPAARFLSPHRLEVQRNQSAN